MATQAVLIDKIKSIIQDTAFSTTDILAAMNECVRYVAGGALLVYPTGMQLISSPLPDLQTSYDFETSTSNPYVSLPNDYGRNLHTLISTTTGIEVALYGSLGEILSSYPKLDSTARVICAAIQGTKLYYQGSPATAEELTMYYHKKPTDMASYAAATISFADSGSRIADSANALDDFAVGQIIDVTGSSSNNRAFTITAVSDDYDYITVSPSPTDESAGDTITIKSRPHGIPDHLHEELVVNYAVKELLKRQNIKNPGSFQMADQFNQYFSRAMMNLESAIETVPEPVRIRSERFSW